MITSFNFSKILLKSIFILIFLYNFSPIQAQSWQTVFFDNFNRTDTMLGNNYNTSAEHISQSGIFNNEVKVTNAFLTPAYWIVEYLNDINFDSIRVSCKFRANNTNFGFSINARDNGINTYSAGIMANTDTIGIYSRDYVGNSNKLSGAKAFFSTSKTYFLQFTLLRDHLSFKYVEVGQTDTITLNTTNGALTGNKVSLSSYYSALNVTNYFDDFRIESFTKNLGITAINTLHYNLYPNPANDMITLTFNNSNESSLTLNIYTILGKLVKSIILEKNQQKIQIEDLRIGVYLVEIKLNSASERHTLIIQR